MINFFFSIQLSIPAQPLSFQTHQLAQKKWKVKIIKIAEYIVYLSSTVI